jgi:predicted DNA-binding transcriptional regulator AlpA
MLKPTIYGGGKDLRNMAQGTQDQLMTVADVISEMGISRSTWQKLVTQEQTPPIVRLGAVQRIRRSAFEAWLAQQEDAPAGNT